MSSLIVTRYLFLRLLEAVFVGGLLLLGVDVIFSLLGEMEKISKDYNFFSILRTILLALPQRILEYLPFVALLGCLFKLGYMSRNGELNALRLLGFSDSRLAGILAVCSFFIALSLIPLNQYPAPQLARQAKEYRATLLNTNTEGPLWVRDEKEYFHLTPIEEGGQIKDLYHFSFDEKMNLDRFSHAEHGAYQKDGAWLLSNLKESRFHSEGISRRARPTSAESIPLTPILIRTLLRDVKHLSITEHFRYISERRAYGKDSSKLSLSLWRILMQPLTVATLVWLAVALLLGPLEGVSASFRVGVAVVLMVIFHFLTGVLGGFGQIFFPWQWLAAIVPSIVCLSVGYWFLR